VKIVKSTPTPSRAGPGTMRDSLPLPTYTRTMRPGQHRAPTVSRSRNRRPLAQVGELLRRLPQFPQTAAASPEMFALLLPPQSS